MLENWCSFVRPLGGEPWIQDTMYHQQVWGIAGFAACVRSGRYVQEKRIAIDTVSEELWAIGTRVTLAYEGNPTKGQGEKTFGP